MWYMFSEIVGYKKWGKVSKEKNKNENIEYLPSEYSRSSGLSADAGAQSKSRAIEISLET